MKLKALAPFLPIFYNDVYNVVLPTTSRFPMLKYRAVRERLQHECQQNSNVTFHVSPLAKRIELTSTHCPKYVDRYLNGQMTEKEIRRAGFPWSEKHVQRATSSVGGTVAAMRAVLGTIESSSVPLADPYSPAKLSCHVAGGTHHAFYDYGEGFCIFNDIAVAANLALLEHPNLVRRILILDLDVHQGNGNAVLFENEPRVFTFSMHCKENYFSPKQRSTIDIELDPETDDEGYLSKLKTWLPYLLDVYKPDLVFYQAGVDIWEGDRLGKLSVTREGLRRRNAIVLERLVRKGIPTVVTMGGGYPKNLEPESDPFQEIVECHCDVYRACLTAVFSTDENSC